MRYRYKKQKKMRIEYMIYSLIIAMMLIYGVMIYSTGNIYSTLSEKTKEAYEASRGPNIEIINLASRECDRCYDAGIIHDVLAQRGANVESARTVYYETDEGKAIAAEYGITRLPSLVITGELNRTHSVNTLMNNAGRQSLDAVIFEFFTPFYDIDAQATRGLVGLTYLTDSSCTSCYNVTRHKDILQAYGVVIIEEKYVDISSKEGKDISSKYNITYLPTVVITSDIAHYDDVKNAWASVGEVANDGSYVFTNTDFMQQLGGNYTQVK